MAATRWAALIVRVDAVGTTRPAIALMLPISPLPHSAHAEATTDAPWLEVL
jgi:hypothetical protein